MGRKENPGSTYKSRKRRRAQQKAKEKSSESKRSGRPPTGRQQEYFNRDEDKPVEQTETKTRSGYEPQVEVKQQKRVKLPRELGSDELFSPPETSTGDIHHTSKCGVCKTTVYHHHDGTYVFGVDKRCMKHNWSILDLRGLKRYEVKEAGGKGLGVFAQKDIEERTCLFRFNGEEKKSNPDNTDQKFVWEVDQNLFIDATGYSVLSKYMNDPMTRDESGMNLNEDKANVEAVVVLPTDTRSACVWFFASRDIKQGEELLFSYGKEYWEEQKAQSVEEEESNSEYDMLFDLQHRLSREPTIAELHMIAELGLEETVFRIYSHDKYKRNHSVLDL